MNFILQVLPGTTDGVWAQLRRLWLSSCIFYNTGVFGKRGRIGVDMGDDVLKMVQLADNGKTAALIAAGSEDRPANVKPGSGDWQKWAVEAIKRLTANGKFRGRDVIAAIPASEVFIEHIKMRTAICDRLQTGASVSEINDDKLRDAILSKIKQKLPVEPAEAVIKCIPTKEDNVLVIATERRIIDKHLAVYEKANLRINSIGVWPIALVNIYTRFFGRRKSDIEAIVMLVCIETNCTNVVICRHKELLFARSISIGARQLDSEETAAKLTLELSACRRQFSEMNNNPQIERLIFLSGRAVDTNLCITIAKQLQMPAQMGDCLAAVEVANPSESGIDRRGCQVNWATAFGLSLGRGRNYESNSEGQQIQTGQVKNA